MPSEDYSQSSSGISCGAPLQSNATETINVVILNYTEANTLTIAHTYTHTHTRGQRATVGQLSARSNGANSLFMQ